MIGSGRGYCPGTGGHVPLGNTVVAGLIHSCVGPVVVALFVVIVVAGFLASCVISAIGVAIEVLIAGGWFELPFATAVSIRRFVPGLVAGLRRLIPAGWGLGRPIPTRTWGIKAVQARTIPAVLLPATTETRFTPGIAGAARAIPVIPIVFGEQLVLEGAQGVFDALDRIGVLLALTGQTPVQAVDGLLQLTDADVEFAEISIGQHLLHVAHGDLNGALLALSAVGTQFQGRIPQPPLSLTDQGLSAVSAIDLRPLATVLAGLFLGLRNQGLDLLFTMASETLSAAAPDSSDEEDDGETSGGSPFASASVEVIRSQLPKDPLLQVRWWAHFDRALRRRLRNLSHAINVEMMRVGLAQGLLPLNLLDAVLDGQVEALPAPANVLRMALPLSLNPVAPASAPTEVLTLLLRSGDLEFEQPRLRTCRQRLEQRRRTLRTMAKRYRTWQRRVSALEAEQQWFQDSAPPQDPAADRT